MKAIYIVSWCLFLLVIYRTQAHDISKRATDDELYVFAERDGGCVSVDSIEPCPVTWKLSAIAAKFYNQQTRQTNFSLNGLTLSLASDECKNAFKTTMCGQAAPECSAGGTQDYNAYGDVATACQKIYSECPKQVVSELFKAQKLCDKVISGRIAKPTCVTPPKIEGNCPQPKYKMPNDACFLYQRLSANNDTIQSLQQIPTTTSQCTSDVLERQCVAIYCSEDEKYLLTEFTKADCENRTKPCLTDPLEESIKAVPSIGQYIRPIIDNAEETCAVYPTGSKKQGPPPTVGTPRLGATVKIVRPASSGPTSSGPTSSGPTSSGPTASAPTSSGPTASRPTSSGNIHLVDCVVLLFSFIVVKLFV